MAITSYIDDDRQLTVYKVEGALDYHQVIEAMESFYSGDPTKNVLWDLNDASKIDVSSEDIRNIANFKPRYQSSRPADGKTGADGARACHQRHLLQPDHGAAATRATGFHPGQAE